MHNHLSEQLMISLQTKITCNNWLMIHGRNTTLLHNNATILLNLRRKEKQKKKKKKKICNLYFGIRNIQFWHLKFT